MKSYQYGIGIFLAALAVVACTRKMDAPSKLSVQVKRSLHGKVGAASTSTLELNRLMINITKPGAPVVVFIADSHNGDFAVPSFVELNVPSGAGQLVQIMAVYKDTDLGGMSFFYADQTVNLTPGPNDLPVTLSELGSSSGVQGRFVGRYALPGPVYPTAKLEMVYDPGSGRQKMVLEETEIVGGWFNLFLLDDVALSYRFKDSKQPLAFTTNYAAGARVQKTSVKLSDFSAVGYSAGVFPGIGIADFSAKTAMYRSFTPSGPGTFEMVDPFKVVYGFHGSNDLPWNGLYMKFYGTSPTNFSHLVELQKNGSNPDCDMVDIVPSVQVADTSTSPLNTLDSPPCDINISPVDYGASITGGDTPGVSSSPLMSGWNSDYLEVDRSFLDGQGNDSVAPFRGILRVKSLNPLGYVSAVAASSCSSGCNHNFGISLVSGVDTIISSIRIYKSSTVSAEEVRGGDTFDCDSVANDPEFSLISSIPITSGTSNYSSNNVPFDASDVSADNPVAICPVDSSGKFLPGAVVFESQRFFNQGL